MKVLATLVVCISLFFTSCDSKRVAEEYKDFESYQWHKDSVATFDFEIKDNKLSYDLSLDIRNNMDYPYYNLYVKYYLKNDKNEEIKSELLDINLFEFKSGKPMGKGISATKDHSYPFLRGYKFPSNGKYKLILKHYMRDELLKGVEAIGYKVAISDSLAE